MKHPLLLLLAVFVLSVAVYSRSLKFQFVLDDISHIVRNENLAHPEFAYLNFTQPTWPGNLYRPAVVASFVVNYSFAALNPWLYHATNVVFHGFTSVVVMLIVAMLFCWRRALFTGILFAVLPIHLEAVVGVSNRTELFAACFGLLSLCCLLVSDQAGSFARRMVWCSLGAVLFFLALCSKESAFVFVPLFFACLTLKHGWLVSLKQFPRIVLWYLFPILVYLLLRQNALGAINAPYSISALDNPLVKVDTFERIANAVVLLGDYLRLCIVPFPLSSDYSYAKLDVVGDWTRVDVWASVFLVIALGVVGIAGFKRNRVLSFWVFWFFVSFLVTANILFPIGTIFAERLSYLPSLGIAGLAAELLSRLKETKISAAILLVLAFLYSGVILRESSAWKHSESLFQKELDISPLSIKMQHNYAAALLESGRLDSAEQHFNAALKVKPDYYPSAYGMSGVAKARGDDRQQEVWLVRSLQSNERFVPALEDLGWLNINYQQFDKAAALFAAALKVDRSSFYSKLGQMAILTRTGEFKGAERIGKALLKRRPKDPNLLRELALLAGASKVTANAEKKN